MKLMCWSFVAFTVIGLATECCFTGVRDQVRRFRRGEPIDRLLPCTTWLWSILVFGLSAVISFPVIAAVYPEIFTWPWPLRGLIYLAGIYGWEFFWGLVLEAVIGKCPWQYMDSPKRFWRYIEPNYAGLWFLYGFVLEWTYLRLIPLLVSIG
jgi:hypothetical protein